jgi:hypothetical protein
VRDGQSRVSNHDDERLVGWPGSGQFGWRGPWTSTTAAPLSQWTRTLPDAGSPHQPAQLIGRRPPGGRKDRRLQPGIHGDDVVHRQRSTVGTRPLALQPHHSKTAAATVARCWAGRRGDRRGSAALVVPRLLVAVAGMALLMLTSRNVAVMSAAVVFGAGFGIAQNATLASCTRASREHWLAEKTGSSFCRMDRACRPTPRSRLH